MSTVRNKIEVRFSRALRHVRLGSQSSHANPATPNSQVANGGGSNSPVAQAGNEFIEEMMDDISKRLASLESSRRDALASLRLIAVELSVAIASKVLLREITEDQFQIKQMVDHMISQVGNLGSDEPVKVQVHPLDLERLNSCKADEGSESGVHDSDTVRLDWIAKPGIGRGNAEIDTTRFSILYDGAIQLNEIRQSLLETLSDVENERRKDGGDNSTLRRFPDRRASG